MLAGKTFYYNGSGNMTWPEPLRSFPKVPINSDRNRVEKSAIISVKAPQAIVHGVNVHRVFDSFVFPELVQTPEEQCRIR